MKYFTIILLLFIGFTADAQYRAIHDHSLNLGITYHSPYSGFTLENRITDRHAIELYFFKGIGYKYYITNPALDKIGFYTGITHIISRPRQTGWTKIPFGIYYLSDSHFQIGFNLSLAQPTYSVSNNEFNFNGFKNYYIDFDLKMGYRFGGLSQEERSYKTLHALLFEAGGATIDYAIHYDISTQINSSPVKVAFAPGFFYRKFDEREQILFPVNLSIMAGGDLNGEVGINSSMGYFGQIKGYSDNNFMIYTFPYAGARYQKRSGGFVVKAGILLIQNYDYLYLMKDNLKNYDIEVKGKDQLLWPTVSLGYTFIR